MSQPSTPDGSSIEGGEPPAAGTFEDHFSHAAASYARHRPRYPTELFERLAELAPAPRPGAPRRAWDCATGSGQAALSLAEHFDEVVATDASAEQIEHAAAHEHVDYRVATAEASGLEDASVELCTAAAAAHWFDHEGFANEVRRVVRPGGLVALFTYAAEVRGHEDVDALVMHYADDILADDWPDRITIVRSHYRDLPFTFDESDLGPGFFEPFSCRAEWSLEDVVGMFATWSATGRHRTRTSVDLLPAFRRELAAIWPGSEGDRLLFDIPLYGRIGRV